MFGMVEISTSPATIIKVPLQRHLLNGYMCSGFAYFQVSDNSSNIKPASAQTAGGAVV